MGLSVYNNKCKKCNYEIIMSGSWWFYRDKNGNKKSYGYSVPTSEEARESGIYGHESDAYCDKCDKVFSIITSEYEVPYFKHCKEKRPKVSLLVRLKAFLFDDFLFNDSIYIPESKKIEIKCPECNNKNMFLGSLEDIVCFHCNEGKFKDNYIHYF